MKHGRSICQVEGHLIETTLKIWDSEKFILTFYIIFLTFQLLYSVIVDAVLAFAVLLSDNYGASVIDTTCPNYTFFNQLIDLQQIFQHIHKELSNLIQFVSQL